MKNERPWAIRVDNLTKRYRLGGAGRVNLRQTITQTAKRIPQALRGERAPRPEDFWALNGVSFDVARGEIVGVLLVRLAQRLELRVEIGLRVADGLRQLFGLTGQLIELR